jgi:hypothetical protein
VESTLGLIVMIALMVGLSRWRGRRVVGRSGEGVSARAA